MSSDILMAVDSGQLTAIVLLDLTSTFDTADQSILINGPQRLSVCLI